MTISVSGSGFGSPSLREIMTPAGRPDAAGKASAPPIRKLEHIEVDAAPEAATVEIRTRNPEMDADWDKVWTERGFLKLYEQIREIKAISQRRYAQGVQQEVQGGLRARDLHKEKGNVFGRIAFDKFLASRKRAVEIAALPKFGLEIDVRIYPPEITVDTNLKWERD